MSRKTRVHLVLLVQFLQAIQIGTDVSLRRYSLLFSLNIEHDYISIYFDPNL